MTAKKTKKKVAKKKAIKKKVVKKKPDYIGFGKKITKYIDCSLVERLDAVSRHVEKYNISESKGEKILDDLVRAKEKYEKEENKKAEELKKEDEKKFEENNAKVEEEEVKEITDKEFARQESNRQEVEEYKKGINWTDNSYYKNSWARLKLKNIAQLKHSNHLFQLFSSEGEITGKPQIQDNDKKTTIKLIVKAKKVKDGFESISYKFLDDPYNRRDDGYEEDVLEESFWAYDIVDDGIKYIVFTKEKLENHEVHTFKGTSVKIHHNKEFDKNLACRGSAFFFFCHSAESTIKPIPKDNLMDYVNNFIEEKKIIVDNFKKFAFEYIFIHENGLIYNQPEDYMMLRHAQLLSGKFEGYPLSMFVWSGFGGGKTQELECVDRIFEETILEAANSTPKSLVPSFSGTRPDPGFLLNCNRIACVDELMKMIDNAINNTRGSNDVKNQLSNLNFLFEHRARRAKSGNGGLYCMPTFKGLFMMNPSLKSDYIHEELHTLDPSTMSRILPYVKAQKHHDFIAQNRLRECAKTYPLQALSDSDLYAGDLQVFAQDFRQFYVTIYDSCQKFLSKVDEDKVRILHETLVKKARNPMKTVWKRRGLHHTTLVLDGIVKYRCIFQDFDGKFEAKESDYELCEKLLSEMIDNWKFNMSITEESIQ